MSKICQSCGTENRDIARFCVGCGSPLEESQNLESSPENQSQTVSQNTDYFSFSEDKKINLDTLKEKIDPEKIDQAKVIAKKATEKATDFVKATANKAKEAADGMESYAEKNFPLPKKGNIKAIPKEGTIQLWSSLNKDFNRRQFYIDAPEKETSREEFFIKLEEKLTENKVPAFIERADVQWDRSNLFMDSYFVTPITQSAVPYTYILQFNKVGKFTFVESRVFITPPDLPIIPSPLHPALLIIIGMLLVLSSLIYVTLSAGPRGHSGSGFPSFLFSVITMGLFILFVYMFFKNWIRGKQIIAARQKWNAAWESWYRRNFINQYQEIIDGSLSRIYDSIDASIDQVDEFIFNQEPVVEKESNDLNTIAAIVNRNKEEYR